MTPLTRGVTWRHDSATGMRYKTRWSKWHVTHASPAEIAVGDGRTVCGRRIPVNERDMIVTPSVIKDCARCAAAWDKMVGDPRITL